MATTKIVSQILDPRTKNLGALGVAMVAAARKEASK